MTADRSAAVPFAEHLELLHSFLTHRRPIVARIQDLLNAQRKPVSYLQDRELLSRQLDECFFAPPAATRAQLSMWRQLEQAHWASGFRPSQVPGLHNDLIDPAEMMVRGFYCWQQTRWPGRNGRQRYAETLFNLALLRRLELLSLRLWDDSAAGAADAGKRLAKLQELLDALWSGSPPDQPVLVRDARWLIPMAQSPTTDELAGYFRVAKQVALGLTDPDRRAAHKASVSMLGGHLRSQIRHYCLKDELSIDDNSVIQRTRTSNALDFALLIEGLVPVLYAYERALDDGDLDRRREWASIVCQGISPDPELFLNRADLLGAYGMIEHLFVSTDDGQVAYTSTGRRFLDLLGEYELLVERTAEALHEDCGHFRPVDGAYSPYGAIFGTPTHLTEDVALTTLTSEPVAAFSIEDVFTDAGEDRAAAAARLDWVNGWRRLPHVPAEVQTLYSYPAQFAHDIFGRVEAALGKRVARRAGGVIDRTGRLAVAVEVGAETRADAGRVRDLPVRYILSSDPKVVAAGNATPCEQDRLLHDRREGHFVLSYETDGGWVAIRKDMLSEVLGAGRDARIAALPPVALAVLRLTCPGLIAIKESC